MSVYRDTCADLGEHHVTSEPDLGGGCEYVIAHLERGSDGLDICGGVMGANGRYMGMARGLCLAKRAIELMGR